MEDKKNLLVTLADKNYINQAKQLFSSVYFNSGWNGDYMLLSYDIPEKELKWFRDKGIIVNKCDKIGYSTKTYPSTVFCKFYLFTSYFKKWKKIIFLDGDMIIKYSLDNLIKTNGIFAVDDYPGLLIDQFIPGKIKEFRKINLNIDPFGPAFNFGVFIFDSSIIHDTQFLELIRLFYKNISINLMNEQSILNLFYYKKWNRLPLVYNFNPLQMSFNPFVFKKSKINAVILHFHGKTKPWLKKNPYYKEWKNNLDRADKIDLRIIQKPEILNDEEIMLNSKKIIELKRKFFLRQIVWKMFIIFECRVRKRYKYFVKSSK